MGFDSFLLLRLDRISKEATFSLDMWFEFLLFTIVTAYGIRVLKYKYLGNPVVGFLIFNWIMGVGLFSMFERTNDADVTHAVIMMLTPGLVLFGSVIADSVYKNSYWYKRFWNQPEIADPISVIKPLRNLFIFCFVISLLYFYFVGYNLFLKALTSSVDDFTTMRLEAYAGNRYLAPGIVNQFKNTLLPLLFFYFAYRLRGKKLFWVYLATTIPLMLYCLAGTGQRTFVFYSILMFFYLSFVYSRGKVNKKLIIGAASIFFVIFIFMSRQLQRIDDTSVSSGLEGLVHRLFASNQLSALAGFRYVYSQPVQYGSEWLQTFIGLIPGQEGSNLSHVIHDILFTSMRGTAPISLWGSAYYNFGLVGTLIFAFMIGFLYEAAFHKMLTGPRFRIRIFAYCGLFLYLSTYISGSPAQLFNNGLPAIFLLLFIIKATFKYRPKYKFRPLVPA